MIKFGHHAKKIVYHIQKHHKTYLLFGGIASGIFAASKIVLFFAASFFLYNASNDASFAQDIDFSDTGTVITGEIQTGINFTGEYLTGDYLSGEININVSDTGTVITGEVQTGTILSGEIITGTLSAYSLSGDQISLSGTENSGSLQEIVQQTETFCTSGNFSMNTFLSGLTFGGVISFAWQITGDCLLNTMSFQIYDHHNQWIEIAVLSGYARGFSFDSHNFLSGWYEKTGLNLSGQTILLYTGLYSGFSTDFWSGYMIKLVSSHQDLLYQSSVFSIDNAVPLLTGISLSSSGTASGLVAIGSPVVLSFTSNEQLTGIRVIIGSGGEATLSSKSGYMYQYTYLMSGYQFSGNISYAVSFQDIAGNTGYFTGISQLSLDTTYPLFTGLVITGNVSGVYLSFTTSEPALSSAFVLVHSTSSGWVYRTTGYSTSPAFTFSQFLRGGLYDVGLSFTDPAGNIGKAALALAFSSTGQLNYQLLAVMYGSTVIKFSTGSVVFPSLQIQDTGIQLTGLQIQSVLQKLKNELIKFNDCKDDIDYTSVKLQIKGKEFTLLMPDFKTSQVKKIVNAFSYYVIQKLNQKNLLSQTELIDITKKFNNFLVIMKLVRDDGNTCKQNLSNYHIEQFKQTLQEYNIDEL